MRQLRLRFYRSDFVKTCGLNRDSNPGPLAPKARIIPLDHWAVKILVIRKIAKRELAKKEFATKKSKCVCSRGWFRSTDLWVMGPARFLCATLLRDHEKKSSSYFYIVTFYDKIDIACEQKDKSAVLDTIVAWPRQWQWWEKKLKIMEN